MMLAATTNSQFTDVIASQLSWWIALDIAEILSVTALLILRDLSVQSRPFDWFPIIFRGSFIWLLLIQSLITAVALVILTGLGRATLNYGIDAWWVALAGLSLLKALPGGGQAQDGRQLSGLLEWLFKKFYGSLRLDIQNQSRRFAEWLAGTYANRSELFLKDVEDFIEGTETAADAVKDKKQVRSGFQGQQPGVSQIEFLANWVAPRGTQKQWRRLTRKRAAT